MVLGTAVDLSVLSCPMLIIMKEQGVDIGRGRAGPRMSGEAEPIVGCYLVLLQVKLKDMVLGISNAFC